MHSAFSAFLVEIRDSRNLSSLHRQLSTISALTPTADDLLRAQVVYCVSAFDRLMHDLILDGLISIFLGNRAQTPRYIAETISIGIYHQLESATIPPKEQVFLAYMQNKLAHLSFQDPTKVADGLSLIWDEKFKWDKIAGRLAANADTTKKTLKLIVNRRNAIVHEADRHPVTNVKNQITSAESSDVADFLEGCGTAIYDLVK